MTTHALAAVALSFVLQAPAQAPRDSARARALYYASFDQQAVLNLDSALALLQAARIADPHYFPAQLEYATMRHTRYEGGVLHREAIKLRESTDPDERCIGIAAAGFTENRDTFDEMRALVKSHGVTPCTAYHLAADPARRDYADSLKAPFFAVGIDDTPEAWAPWAIYHGFLRRSGRWAEARRTIERAEQAVRHPLLRVRLAMDDIGARLAQGDTIGASALRRAVRAAMERDGRAGVRAEYESNPCARSGWVDTGDRPDDTQRRLLQRVRVSGDWAWMERSLIDCGHALLDRGETLQALEALTRAIPIADSVRLPDLYLELYLQRGRVNAKLGRTRDAERDLERALSLGVGAGRLYNVADAYQQRAEMYASAGRWPEANRAVDRFVAIARPMMGGLHFSSLLDAGEIRWKTGWHAAARAAFDEMVRVSDSLGIEHYWAGAYYERIGDLERARLYYKRACAEYGWNSRAQSGLVHVYEALGQLDSAEAVARVHDAQEALWPPLELPLMPALLAHRGRSAEAIRVATVWARHQQARGNLQGAVAAFLWLARLAVDAHSAQAALAAATHAESLSISLHLLNEQTQSVMMRGIALDRLGSESALAELRSAAGLASRDSTADNTRDAYVALGDALARRAHTDDALAAYDRAARTGERVAGSLAIDLDRARYRDRHLLAFDGAMAALLRAPPSRRQLDQLVAWSARRKAAALALATRRADRPSTSTGRRTTADMQRELGATDAMLDYVVVDSVVAVIVTTRERTSLTRLAISRDSLAALIERLRRPLVAVYGGRVDLARAPFDLAASSSLHAVLVRPIEPLLGGKRHLVIVPDGPLHALPFEALVVSRSARRTVLPDYLNARYLIDDYEVSYLPSSAFSARSRQTATSLSGSRLLVVASDAPGVDRETVALRAAWPAGRRTVFEGPGAAERAVKVAMPGFDVIHFAVHAQSSARDPLTSHLRLAADSTDDGYLNLNEIASMRLTARLVVLSGCETDVGLIYNGEGAMGLARAFLAAGAGAVIGAQWPIGPTTAELMGRFYQRLAAGESSSPALRAAKLALRSSRATAHPFYWAGPVLVAGSGSP